MTTLTRTLAAMILPIVFTGCASTAMRDPSDPLEPMNRKIFAFNQTVDDAALKPLAKGYRAITPTPVQTAVRNVFSNLDDVTEFANNLLQFKVQAATSDLLRISVNSTFGLLGLIDIASEMRLQKHNEDFGQTLGRWGIKSGPYLVLPILGPSSVRDGTGILVDSNYLDPVYQISHIPTRDAVLGFKLIARRADLLDAQSIIDQAALDKYLFTRDIYLERRQAMVYDGNPPDTDE